MHLSIKCTTQLAVAVKQPCSRENISELPNLSVKHWTVKNEECLSLIKKKYLPGIPLGIIESSAF